MLSRLRAAGRPRLAVHKFTSCDGCQLTILDCEETLLDLAEAIDIAFFREAGREPAPDRCEIAFVEGSVSTPEEIARTRRIRASAGVFVAFGACATAGGVQALRNFGDLAQLKAAAGYPDSAPVNVLPTSTPHSAHVPVDFELPGCPPNREQFLEVVTQLLLGRTPRLPGYSVCLECKRRGNVCVLVARELPCLGPVTRDGCGALCPSHDRACYGCFGPLDDPRVDRFGEELSARGLSASEIARLFRQVTPWSEAFARGGARYAGKGG
jgi:coenzyme F420-reducing hydrogenase gamma subunit